ncbi:hypothetical protein C8J56DRAFT_755784, partial [Mycena floridula]
EKLEKLREEVKATQRNISQLERSLCQFASEISPVRSIPPEILTEIFSRCITERYNPSSRSAIPRILSQVCSSWRALAISSPALWTSINIFADAGDRNYSNLEEALERSGNRHLDL